MKINKFKAIPIATFGLVVALWSEVQCAEESSLTQESHKKSMLLTKPELFTDDASQLVNNAPLKLMNNGNLSGYFGHPFDHSTLIEHEEKITIVTDHNISCGYQLESQRFVINEGEIINIPYTITVHRGRMSLGLLGTTRTSWLDTELILEEGKKTGIYKVIVPQGQTKTSLVFRNYHQEEPGHSTFTIENVKIEKKIPTKKKYQMVKDLCADLQDNVGFWKNKDSVVGSLNLDGSQTIITSKNEKSYQFKFNFDVDDAKELLMPLSANVQCGTIVVGFLNDDESKWIWQTSLNPGQHNLMSEVPINEYKKLSFIIADHNPSGSSSTFMLQKLQILLR